MATVKGMSKFPVLPPIEGTQQRGEGGQTAAAAKEEIKEKIAVHNKLLRHRRSKVQQEQLHRILYVFSSSFVTASMMNDPSVQPRQLIIM